MYVSKEALAVAMIRRNLNVKQLAELTGVTRGTISAIRSGKRCSKKTAAKLVRVLGPQIMADYVVEAQ